MTFNIVGALENQRMNRDQFICIKELLSNSIESCMLRKEKDSSFRDFEIKISTTHDEKNHCQTITVLDNGIGFSQDEWREFCIPYTTNKKLFKCKGTGRIQFWHYFATVKIKSVFKREDQFHKFDCTIQDDERKAHEEWHQEKSTICNVSDNCNTAITLEKPKYELLLPDEEINVMIYNHFLPKLVYVKDIIKANVKIFLNSKEVFDTNNIQDPFLRDKIVITKTSLESGLKTEEASEFDVVCYKVPQAKEHAIWLCAKDIAVDNIAKFVIHDPSLLKQTTDNKDFVLVFIKDAENGKPDNEFLNKKISSNRERFEDFYSDFESWKEKNENYTTKLWNDDEIFKRDFAEELEKILDKVFSFSGKTREQIKEELKKDYNITDKIISDLDIRIKYGEEPVDVLRRIHVRLAKKSADETKKIVDVKKEIESLNVDPSNLNWREDIEKKSESLALLNKKDHNLLAISELMNRLCKEELLRKAIEGELKNDDEKGHESLIHNLFFKIRSNSKKTANHDLWMLSEEYGMYYYISSDESLSNIIDNESGELVFDFNLYNKKIEELGLKDSYGNNKRPDIAIFKDGSIVLIEFKAPFRVKENGSKEDIFISDHTRQLEQYADIVYTCLKPQYKEKYKKYYLYLIGKEYGHLPSEFRKNETIDKRFFKYLEISNLNDPKDTASCYYEVMRYNNLQSMVKTRNDFFRKKLFPDADNAA